MTQDENGREAGRATARPGPEGGGTGPDRPPAGGKRGPIDAAARARIGRGLRLHYAEVLALPVPERLLALVDSLARSDTEDER